MVAGSAVTESLMNQLTRLSIGDEPCWSRCPGMRSPSGGVVGRDELAVAAQTSAHVSTRPAIARKVALGEPAVGGKKPGR